MGPDKWYPFQQVICLRVIHLERFDCTWYSTLFAPRFYRWQDFQTNPVESLPGEIASPWYARNICPNFHGFSMGLPPSRSAADHNAWCVVNLLTESWCSTRQCAQWSSAAVAWYSSCRWCNCTVLHCYWPYDGWLAETLYVIVATHTHNRLTGDPVTETGFYWSKNSEWQWHQLGHMQVCTSLQTDNHASTTPLRFLQAGCPSCGSTNSVEALKA